MNNKTIPLRIPIQVLVYPVKKREVEWQYLMLKRIKSRGGFWQGVTGAVEEGENLLDTAKRELFEETGYRPRFIVQMKNISYSIKLNKRQQKYYSPEIKSVSECVFVARIEHPNSPIIDPKEHDEWKWCNFEEAMGLLSYDDNKKALEIVQKFLELEYKF